MTYCFPDRSFTWQPGTDPKSIPGPGDHVVFASNNPNTMGVDHVLFNSGTFLESTFTIMDRSTKHIQATGKVSTHLSGPWDLNRVHNLISDIAKRFDADLLEEVNR